MAATGMSQDEVLDQIYPETVGPILDRAKIRETERLLDLVGVYHTADAQKLHDDLQKSIGLKRGPGGPITADAYESQMETVAAWAEKSGNAGSAAEIRRKLGHYRIAKADRENGNSD